MSTAGMYRTTDKPNPIKVEICGETRIFPVPEMLLETIGELVGEDVLEYLSNKDTGMIPVTAVHQYCDGECDASMAVLEDARDALLEVRDSLDSIRKLMDAQRLDRSKISKAIEVTYRAVNNYL